MNGNKKIIFSVFIISLLALSACDQIVKSPTTTSTTPYYYPTVVAAQNTTVMNVTDASSSLIRLGSFNVQVLGVTKQTDPTVQTYLPSILKQYDIVVVQELREGTGSTAAWLGGQLPGYSYKLSPRLGRTTSKEQYMIIYNNKATITGEWTYVDSLDAFEREPYGVLVTTTRGKTFILLTIHVDPDHAEDEIRNLQFAIPAAQSYFGVQDFVLVGDLNADCTYYDENLYYLKSYQWLISNGLDTTVHDTDCTYDRIITNTNYMSGGVVDNFDSTYGLTQQQALDISDHYPVYATVS